MLYLYFLYSFDDTISISICILFPICICWYNQWYHGGHNTRPPISQQFPRGSLIEAQDDENDDHVVIFHFLVSILVVVPSYRIYFNQQWCEVFSYTLDMKISVPFVVVSQTEDLREVEIKLIAGFILWSRFS